MSSSEHAIAIAHFSPARIKIAPVWCAINNREKVERTFHSDSFSGDERFERFSTDCALTQTAECYIFCVCMNKQKKKQSAMHSWNWIVFFRNANSNTRTHKHDGLVWYSVAGMIDGRFRVQQQQTQSITERIASNRCCWTCHIIYGPLFHIRAA